MNSERYCAEQIRLHEGETFLAVASKAGVRFDPKFQESRAQGAAIRLPDLFSVTSEARYRIREVKFKLEDRLVRKALTQLEVGAKQLLERDPRIQIDRLEIVVPLRGRKLQSDEAIFLGRSVGPNRHILTLDEREAFLACAPECQVTVLVIY